MVVPAKPRPGSFGLCILLAGSLWFRCTGPGDPLAELKTVTEPYGLDQIDRSVQEQYHQLRAELDRQTQARPFDSLAAGEAYGRLGKWHQTYRYPEGALTCYDNALKLNSKDYRWPYYAAHIHQLWGRIEEARDAFQKALALKPDDEAALIWLAELEISDNRDVQAKPLLEKVLRRNPQSVRALLNLGRLALNEKKYEQAIPLLETAYRLQPDATKVRYALGMAYKGVGDRERAQNFLAGAMVGIENEIEARLEDPLIDALGAMRVSGRHHATRGQMALRKGQTGEAVEAFQKAVEAAPDKPGLRLQLGEALLADRQAEASVRLLEETVRLFPEHPASFNKLGIVYARLGRWQRAEDRLRQALVLNPQYQEAHFNLAVLLLRTDRCAQAKTHFDSAVALEPSHGGQRYQRVLCVLKEQGPLAGIRQLERDLTAVPEDPQLKLLQARLLATLPNVEPESARRALALARQGFDEAGNLVWAETVAMAHAALKDFERARAWQRAAINATQNQGNQRPMPWLVERMNRFQAGKACDRPWAEREFPVHDVRVEPPSP